jgi:hypothetical protein
MSDNSLRAERAVLHPMWLVALVLLVANDHFFKGAGILHEIATGKLSDVAGLVVAPALLATLLRIRNRRGVAVCHFAVGGVFAFIQIVPGFAQLVESTMTSLGVPWQLWPDLTDLLTLPALLVSWRVLLPAMYEPVVGHQWAVQLSKLSLATVGLFACVGTSSVAPPPHTPRAEPQAQAPTIAAPDPVPDMSSLTGYSWRASNSDGTWQLTYRFLADGTYTATGQPAWQESGKVNVLRAESQRLVLRLTQRTYDGKQDDDVDRELVFAADGASFVLNEDRYDRLDNVATIALDEDYEDEEPLE